MSDRKRLPSERKSITHKFRVGEEKGYLTVGLFDDGSPGEVFVRIAKEGSTLSGVLDSFAVMVSLALQHGVSLETLVGKFRHVRFEPSGQTGNPAIPFADSIIDYIFNWLGRKFLEDYESRTLEEADMPLRAMQALQEPGASVQPARQAT